MRIAFLSPSISRKGGGVLEAIRPLACALAKQGAELTVLGLRDQYSDDDLSAWSPLRPLTFQTMGLPAFGFSPSLGKALVQSRTDLLHVHGLWMYPSIACMYWAHKSSRPYVLTPHGMLHPRALEMSSWKKKVAGLMFEHRHIRGAACIHAASENEANLIRQYGIRRPICIIPNGITLPFHGGGIAEPRTSARKKLLYLGRLHPQKGLLTLLHAWERVCRSDIPHIEDWCLTIAGWDQHAHEAELKAFCRQHSLCDSVCFIGPQFGTDKDQTYRAADAFVLPSPFESVGMVVLEAWSYKLPVLMTTQGYLTEGFECEAAIPMEFSLAGMVEGLQTLLKMTDQDRWAMGKRGHHLVEEQFRWAKIATSMKSVYEWILFGGSKPNCVYMS
jgi:glycosyltransferase involved in cell wall biosynthesis